MDFPDDGSNASLFCRNVKSFERFTLLFLRPFFTFLSQKTTNLSHVDEILLSLKTVIHYNFTVCLLQNYTSIVAQINYTLYCSLKYRVRATISSYVYGASVSHH